MDHVEWISFGQIAEETSFLWRVNDYISPYLNSYLSKALKLGYLEKRHLESKLFVFPTETWYLIHQQKGLEDIIGIEMKEMPKYVPQLECNKPWLSWYKQEGWICIEHLFHPLTQ